MAFQAEWLHLHQEITSQGPWVSSELSVAPPRCRLCHCHPPLQTGALRLRHDWLRNWQCRPWGLGPGGLVPLQASLLSLPASCWAPRWPCLLCMGSCLGC